MKLLNHGFSSVLVLLVVTGFLLAGIFSLQRFGTKLDIYNSNHSPEEQLSTSNSINENSKQELTLELLDLKVTIKNDSFNQPVRVHLYANGYLDDPAFDQLVGYSLDIHPVSKDNNEPVTLEKPIILEFDWEKSWYKNSMLDCEYNFETTSFYALSPSPQEENDPEFSKKTVKLDTVYDENTGKLHATLNNLGVHQRGSVFTDIVLGVEPSKFRLGCGKEARAYIEDEYFYLLSGNLKIRFSQGLTTPQVRDTLIGDIRTTLYLQDDRNIEIVMIYRDGVVSINSVKELGHLQIPGYEFMESKSVFEGETILSENVLSLGNNDFLEVTSEGDSNTVYRLLTLYEPEKIVYFEIFFDEGEYDAYGSKYISIVKDTASSLIPLE